MFGSPARNSSFPCVFYLIGKAHNDEPQADRSFSRPVLLVRRDVATRILTRCCQDRQAHGNKAVVARAFRALDQGDLATLNDVFDPKAPIHSSHGTTTLQGGPFAELRGSCPMCANLSDRKITIDKMISEGDFITVRSTWSGTFSGTFRGTQFSGKNIHIVYTNIYRIAGGRICGELVHSKRARPS